MTYLVKNVILAIFGHFWAWPLCATFWISTFKLSYATFPLIKFIFPAPWSQWLPRGSKLRVTKLRFWNHKIQKTLKLGHVISPWPNGLGANFGWFLETSNHALSRGEIKKGGFFIPSWCNLGSKKWRFCKKTRFFTPQAFPPQAINLGF